MKILAVLLRWLVVLSIPIVLVGTGLRLILLPQFLQVEYRMPHFPPDSYGFSTADRLYWATLTWRYLVDPSDAASLAVMTFGDGSVEMHRLSKPDPASGDLLSLDLLVVTPALAAAWETRERIRWEHGSIPVVSRAGLIAMKRLRGSGQDQDDIRALEADDAEG